MDNARRTNPHETLDQYEAELNHLWAGYHKAMLKLCVRKYLQGLMERENGQCLVAQLGPSSGEDRGPTDYALCPVHRVAAHVVAQASQPILNSRLISAFRKDNFYDRKK